MSACRSCQAPIRWARTEHERRIPLDADPYTGPEPAGLFVPHFSTCPNANEWRRTA